MDLTKVSRRIVASGGQEPVGEQREIVRDLTQLYVELGVIDGAIVPCLKKARRVARDCWKDAPEGSHPAPGPSVFDSRSEPGCIVLPSDDSSHLREVS